MRQALLVCVSLSVLLGACGSGAGGPTAIAEPTLNPPAPTSEVPQTSFPEPLEVISVENIDRLELLETWGEGVVYDVAASPDGRLIAALAETGIYIYDSKSLVQIDFIDDPNTTASYSYGEAITYSNDSTLLAYSDGQRFQIADVHTHEAVAGFVSRVPNSGATRLEFVPGVEAIVVTAVGEYPYCDAPGANISVYDYSGISLINLSTCLFEYQHKYEITENGDVYIFIEDSVYILRTSNDFQVQIIRDADLELDHENPGGGFYGVSPDGKFLAYMDYGSDVNSTLLYKIESAEVVEDLPGVEEYYGHIASPGLGGIGVFGTRDPGEVLEDDCRIGTVDNNSTNEIIAKDSNIVTVGRHALGVLGWRWIDPIRALEVWDVASCQLLHERRFVFAINGKANPDGQYLATTNGFDTHLWRFSGDGNVDFVFPGEADYGPMNLFSFNSDGTLIATGSSLREPSNPDPVSLTHIMSIWDVETGTLLQEINQSREALTDFYQGPLPSIFLTDDTERGVSTYDAESGLMLKRNFRTPFVYDAIRQGFWTVSDSSQRTYIVLVGFPDGQTKRIIISPMKFVDSIDLDSTGRYLVVSSWGSLSDVVVIDIHTSKVHYSANPVSPIFPRDPFASVANAFSPWGSGGFSDLWRFDGWNGATLFSGSFSPAGDFVVVFDGYRLAFWDSAVGMQVSTGFGSDFVLIDPKIMFTPDGRLLIVIGNDGLIRLYGVRAESP